MPVPNTKWHFSSSVMALTISSMLPAVSFWADAQRLQPHRATTTIINLQIFIAYYRFKRFIFVWGFSTS